MNGIRRLSDFAPQCQDNAQPFVFLQIINFKQSSKFNIKRVLVIKKKCLQGVWIQPSYYYK